MSGRAETAAKLRWDMLNVLTRANEDDLLEYVQDKITHEELLKRLASEAREA